MKAPRPKKVPVRIVVVDSDPLRQVGFRACQGSESDFAVQSASCSEVSKLQGVDIVLLGGRTGTDVIEVLSTLRAMRPDLDIIITGCNLGDEAILKAISAGAKGCVDEASPVNELARAIRIVHAGSVWAPRRVLAMFVERAYRSSVPGISIGQRPLTSREKEVLKMLVAGCSNKEIAAPLGIEERTVKAHVAKLMRKVGAPNRILLSVHAITHSLVHV